MIESNNLKEVLKILGFKPKDSNTIPHSSPAQPITQPNNTQVLSDELNRGGGAEQDLIEFIKHNIFIKFFSKDTFIEVDFKSEKISYYPYR